MLLDFSENMRNLLYSGSEMTMPLNQRGLLRHIHDLNRWNPENFCPFYIADHRVGYLKHYLCKKLKQWPNYFLITEDAVRFRAEVDRVDDRSHVLDEVVHLLVEQGVIKYYLGETYPVTGASRDQVLAKMDRGAAIYFGIKTYGQHLNGYNNSDQGLKLWTARRAPDRIRFPNMLDNLVAGGLPENLSLYDNLIKECEEEADIPVDLVKTAKAVGAVSYCRETKIGLKPDTLYCYDLELPETFVPQNTDGEVSEFQLLPVEEIIELIRNTNEFKPNCNLVNLDFLIRHGLISPDEPDYLELVSGLHGVT
jgi:8-oxo-dGTP pyrophosphatase MutT (NUDIX family)